MENKGITLIELLVVITIAGVLFMALGFEFTGWRGKYRVESQIKEIYNDLMDARINAMQTNRVHFVSLLNTTSYTLYEDTDEDEATPPDAGDTELGSFPKSIKFDIRWDYADVGVQENIEFNGRGLITNLGSISFFVDSDGDGEKDFVPDYDCIIIARTRINMGQLNAAGDNCNAK